MRRLATMLALAALVTSTTHADTVTVEALGQVFFNGISTPPLGGVASGESAILSFTVDSNNFVDGVPGDTRGYVIDESSFVLSFSGGVSVGLQNPFPAGQTPYFGLIEGFPVSDGFFVSTSTVSPGGVPLSQTPVQMDLSIGYSGDTLTSLDILDALGVYGFTGLTSFSFNLWQVFPDNVVLGMDFVQLTISAGPVSVEPTSWGGVKALFR